MQLPGQDARIPLYCQLMEIIVAEIENDLPRDAKLPSERAICEKYGLSRSTVRQALQALEQEGYIYKIHGKGTYVSPKKLNQDLLKFYSFTNEMKKINKMPTSQVLDFKVVECDKKLAQKMKVDMGAQMYSLVRLRLADGEPMILEKSYIPCKRFAGLTQEDFSQYAMYDIFVRRFAVDIIYAEEKFQAVPTDEKTAKLLGIQKEIPCLKIERYTYEKEQVIEYTISMARGDQFIYSIKLDKKELD